MNSKTFKLDLMLKKLDRYNKGQLSSTARLDELTSYLTEQMMWRLVMRGLFVMARKFVDGKSAR